MVVEIVVPDNADSKKVSCKNEYCQSFSVVPNVVKIGWLIRCECCGNAISEHEFSMYKEKNE